ncbi:MAG: LytTR family DNA-binding domain-containing protein [Bacteroidota bacterium]
MWLTLNYDFLKNWKAIVLTTFVMILLYEAVVYFHPENLDWLGSDYFSWSNLIWFVFVDQFLIECVTVAILFWLIRIYARVVKLTALQLTINELVKYELKFLPLFLLAYFVFAPFPLTLRYLLHHFPTLDWAIYLEEYSYSIKTYVNYLTPVILVGYTILNVNLLRQYNQQLGVTKNDLHQAKKPKVKDRLWASDEFGELFLEVEKIQWIEREDRKLMAWTGTDQYRLKGNMTELEEKLSPDHFVRVNRSAIVNLRHVSNYSFWENDKYILRMKERDQEFVMSRDRLNKIKDRLVQE